MQTRILLSLAPAVFILASSACGGGSAGGERSPSRLLLADSFDNGTVNPLWTLTPLRSNYAPHTAANISVTNPPLAGASLQYHILRGQNEVSPINLDADPEHLGVITGTPSVEEFYFEWHEYFESRYPFPTSSQKLLRFGFDDPSLPMSRKEFGVLIQDSNADLNVQYFCGAWGDDSVCSVDQAIHSSRPMPTDRWVKLGLWVRLNSPGDSDGFVRLFLDDGLLIAGEGLDLRGSDNRGYNFMWLGGNYSMLTGGTARGTGSRYIDEVKWYSTFPD